MKYIQYRILSFIMCFVLILTVSMSYSLDVYAIPQYNWDTKTWDSITWQEAFDQIYASFAYVGSQIGVIAKGDFKQFLYNHYDWNELWNNDGWLKNSITINEDKQEISFSDDLVSLIKQAYIDYANEMNEFWIVPTQTVLSMDASSFYYRDMYTTIRYLAQENGMIFINGCINNSSYKGRLFAADSNYFDEGYVFINNSGQNELSDFILKKMPVTMYDQNWNKKSSKEFRQFNITDTSGAFTSLSSGSASGFSPTSFYLAYSAPYWYGDVSRSALNVASVFTSDGCRVRVYKSLNSYKLYSVGQRAVYFGSGFYDAEVGQLEGSFDDLEDSINRLDETLKKLLDQIDDTTDESEIEDLLQKILDELKNNNSGGNGGGGGNSGNSGNSGDSGNYGSILDDILEYLKKINSGIKDILEEIKGFDFSDLLKDISSSLKGISEEIKDLDFSVDTGQDDGILGDLISFLASLLDDPEQGSQDMLDALSSSLGEVAGGLTEKFPFSIPWDIQYIFLQLSDTPRAPKFEYPLYIKSFGINETIVVDMEKFQTLSNLSRTMLSMLFVIYLINLTFKVIGIRKED